MHRDLTRGGFLKSSGLGLAGLGLTLNSSPRRASALDASQGAAHAGTNATYFNDASFDAADPYVLRDERSEYYYAYSTDGGGRDASGVRLALGNPLNRVAASLDRPGTVTPDAEGRGATVAFGGRGAARLTLTYQRKKASGAYEDVYNIVTTSDGTRRQEPVSVTITLG